MAEETEVALEEVAVEAVVPVADVPDSAAVIPAGVDAVVDNPVGGSIVSEDTAFEVSGDAVINNAGEIAGGFNGVDFTEVGTGTLNNTGLVTSDSRAVQIEGDDVTINNDGAIIGTDDQRNGTVYSDESADDFEINNRGLIDAGEGNEGAGISTELVAEGTTFDVNNEGLIQGRGDAAAGLATAGDGIRLERTRVDGALDGTTTGLFDGVINNSGLIDSEGANGTVAGFRAVNGVDFQGQLNNEGRSPVSKTESTSVTRHLLAVATTLVESSTTKARSLLTAEPLTLMERAWKLTTTVRSSEPMTSVTELSTQIRPLRTSRSTTVG